MSLTGTVLLVDSDKDVLNMNRASLELRRFSVYMALTFAEAQAHLKTITPDIVITEAYLPEGSGFDFGRGVIRQTDAYLFFLSAKAEPNDISKAHDAGCDSYIAKPYAMERLMGQVEAVMRRRGWVGEAKRV